MLNRSNRFSESHFSSVYSSYTPKKSLEQFQNISQEDQRRSFQISDTLQQLRMQEEDQEKVSLQLKEQIQYLRQKLDSEQQIQFQEINALKQHYAIEEKDAINEKKSQIEEVQGRILEIQKQVDTEIQIHNDLILEIKSLRNRQESQEVDMLNQTKQAQSQADFYKSQYETVTKQEVGNLQTEMLSLEERYETLISQLKKEQMNRENEVIQQIDLKEELVNKMQKELQELQFECEEEKKAFFKESQMAKNEVNQYIKTKNEVESQLTQLQRELDENRKFNLLITQETRLLERDAKRIKNDNESLRLVNSRYERSIYGKASR